MSDNLTRFNASQIEFEITSNNIVRFENSPIFEIIVEFDNPPVFEIINTSDKPRRKRVSKWTLSLFLEHAREIHGYKYDYSEIKAYHINGRDSYIPIKCNICKYEWSTTTIHCHINGKADCPDCAGNLKWTLSRFLIRARQIHDNKYDYNEIRTHHINGSNSLIPIKCNICTYEWEPFLSSHIAGKGCPDCAGNAPWTLSRFLTKARQIHDNKYDYSEILESHIVNINSYIPIKCNICNYEWSTSTIHGHINDRNGCPDCAGHAPWTLNRFLIRARQIHSDKFNYYQVLDTHFINGVNSYIPIKCNTCNYEWSTATVDGHINGRSGCPDCAGHVPWTLDRFLKRASQIHGDKFDYSQALEIHFVNIGSRIPMKCRKCDYECSPTIHLHVNGKAGCADCAGHVPWTLDRFLKRARQVHGEKKYNYDYVLGEHFVNVYSRIPIKCNKCNSIWSPSIANHITGKTGCSKCRFSKGEMGCCQILEFFNISYECQYILTSLPKRRYDFMFVFNNNNYVLEYDGMQHFIDIQYFGNKLKEIQESDLIKTKAALLENYLMIRIDYSQIDNIQYHICKAIQENNKIYYSTPDLYSYIINNL